VFFLTTGFGDVHPHTPGGRGELIGYIYIVFLFPKKLTNILFAVVFVFYSLMAVPIVASLAIQAIIAVVTKFSSYRLDQRLAQLTMQTSTVTDEEQVTVSTSFSYLVLI
jgi:hypothetical protein